MPTPSAPGAEARTALTAGIGCYLIWGFVPLAFQLMGRMGISPWEIVAHRTIWAVPVALAFVLAAHQSRQVLSVLRNARVMGWLTLSATLIGGNWLLYIWAVNSGRVLETSLGYYINPLLAMAAGALIFGERIDRFGALAIGLAAIGVIIQTLALGHLPVVSLVLALTFCGYAIVRKRVAADAQTGLLVECLLLAGPSLVYAIWLQGSGAGNFGADVSATAWLLACGPLTATPLMLFAWAARRIPLSFMGFLQFMGPTIGFGIGLSQGEAFTPVRAASFVFIWGGAAVFAWGAWRRSRAPATAS
ncbi:EamA family transporter RarD [Phenylobacterium sp.]|uniref:EamA family transporter RarD n=1 Tax=Phenylobacterium sp. TaxID=1871053 RepID=UPI0037C7900E